MSAVGEMKVPVDGNGNRGRMVHSNQASQCNPDLADGLLSKVHLRRDRSLNLLRNSVRRWSEGEILGLEQRLVSEMIAQESWEQTCGAVRASQVILQEVYGGGEGSLKSEFSSQALDACTSLIEHSEARVREATSSLIGTLAAYRGVEVWEKMGQRLLDNIMANFELDESQRLLEAARIAGQDLDQAAADAKLHGLRMVHETEGWRGLETMLLAISDLLKGCGPTVLAPAAQSGDLSQVEGLSALVSYIIRAKDHPNRFVREAGLRLLDSLAVSGTQLGAGEGPVVVAKVAKACFDVILEGLQDNWSQVRFAASIVVRTILKSVTTEFRRSIYPDLLPRMCLNRHYVAEGVRVFSQETWRSVIAEDGKVYLLRHLEKCITYYESQCVADNHAVREAACQAFGEATLKLDGRKVMAYVPRITAGLVVCFKDESWPVRDHACRALADVISRFGAQVRETGRLSELYGLFDAHLADNIASVRQNSAEAMVKAALAFEADDAIFGLHRLARRCQELMRRIGAQEEREFGGGGSRDRDSGYGSASKVARDNDVALHTEQTMFSCGSLAPKLRRGGGCMDHGFSRAKEAWEEADGGVRLWGQLTTCGAVGARVGAEALESFVDAFEMACAKRFGHEDQLVETMLSTMAVVAGVVGGGCWTEGLLVRVVRLNEGCRKRGNARVSSAAAAAITCMRRCVGFAAYSAAGRA